LWIFCYFLVYKIYVCEFCCKISWASSQLCVNYPVINVARVVVKYMQTIILILIMLMSHKQAGS